MRKQSKFRIFIQSNFSLSEFPLRLLNFKRQKWVFLQKKLQRIIKPRAFKKKSKRFLKKGQVRFTNPCLVKLPRTRWVRYRRSYTNELNTKRLFYILYQRAIERKFLRSQIKLGWNRPSRMIALLVKPYLRVDVLFRYLNFFSSVYQARQVFARGKLTVNNKIKKTPVFLICGDIAQVKTNNANSGLLVSTLRKRNSKKTKLFSFIMVDYYTKSVVILKAPKDLSGAELALMSELKINYRSFKHLF